MEISTANTLKREQYIIHPKCHIQPEVIRLEVIHPELIPLWLQYHSLLLDSTNHQQDRIPQWVPTQQYRIRLLHLPLLDLDILPTQVHSAMC